MLNHVVLMGEVTEINESGVLLRIDEKTIIQINLSPLFQEILNEFYKENVLLALQGSIVLDEENHVSIEASKIQFPDKNKEQIKTYQHKDISR